MTVKELKEKLKDVPDGYKVFLRELWCFENKQITHNCFFASEGRVEFLAGNDYDGKITHWIRPVLPVGDKNGTT